MQKTYLYADRSTMHVKRQLDSQPGWVYCQWQTVRRLDLASSSSLYLVQCLLCSAWTNYLWDRAQGLPNLKRSTPESHTGPSLAIENDDWYPNACVEPESRFENDDNVERVIIFARRHLPLVARALGRLDWFGTIAWLIVELCWTVGSAGSAF